MAAHLAVWMAEKTVEYSAGWMAAEMVPETAWKMAVCSAEWKGVMMG